MGEVAYNGQYFFARKERYLIAASKTLEEAINIFVWRESLTDKVMDKFIAFVGLLSAAKSQQGRNSNTGQKATAGLGG